MRTAAGSWVRFVSCSVIVSASLAACGGGGGGGSAPAQATSPPSSSSSTSGSGNSAPTITGSAETTVHAGTEYSFVPTASDADNDAVTFTIANKPSWASFNKTTGVLTGTPDDSDVGTFNGIEIAATDGEAVTALPSFNVTVSSATATGSVSLAWTPPTQNEDGSTLTDLSGYKIHYGTASKTYSESVAINSAGITRYELESVPTGKIFIAMTSLSKSGAESDYSRELAITVK
jgi:hypothetical protein